MRRAAKQLGIQDDQNALRLSLASLIDAGIMEEESSGIFWFAPLDSLHLRLSQWFSHLMAKHGHLKWVPIAPSPRWPGKTKRGGDAPTPDKGKAR